MSGRSAVSLAAGPLRKVVPDFRQRTRGWRERRFRRDVREDYPDRRDFSAGIILA